ncbi:MAG: imidazole glycerol phosphate synthase subunit HisH [Methylophilaceae bacterium]|nr:imidazole glycerol phosphate synthase subunit HisH [Methylophilaceae bacterium]MBL6726387.1 imidazole glycerol phosphate synthase subunit HisH [Methylophilaceae bacterium]MBL6728517.1 imidazole glycerol phosphate synthase subunit HisH [Methylophilaceae bacterium]MBL6790650.1 imidazole glycerol phosphate synthase subunit HisH [Methylophilaceae bacterium]
MIAIIDYGMGNLKSVHNAFKYIVPSITSVVTSDPNVINSADRIVFPGQGAMPDCIREIEERGLKDAIINAAAKKPFLGICIGLQMLFDKSDEGDITGLQILKGSVRRFISGKEKIKIPHMGWNSVSHKNNHPLWRNISSEERFYFVHSYYVKEEESGIVQGQTEYGQTFTSAIAKDNLFACQFHPEKSGSAGLQLLKNFSSWVC